MGPHRAVSQFDVLQRYPALDGVIIGEHGAGR
jgi:hypothetical protein